MMIAIRLSSSKNAIFQHFIFTADETNRFELMHQILIIDTALRSHSTGFIQVELRGSG